MSDQADRIYLIPGMFGFGTLAGYDYFVHMRRALVQRFAEAGRPLEMEVIPTPPTASIRRRARVLAMTVWRNANKHDGPIHLIGHSTGGLDARLLASPSAHLHLDEEQLAWTRRIESIVTINTPHHGTPLAYFLTTVSGTRLLYALSLLTFTTLRYGGAPLSVLSSLVAAVGAVDEALGIDIHLLDRATALVLRVVGDQGREDVHKWLEGIQRDQGGIIQVTPEAMDLFNSATELSPYVRAGSIATASPAPTPMRLMGKMRSPFAALSATIYSTLYAVASRPSKTYPCPVPPAESAKVLARGFEHAITESSIDGVVPTLSMLWGKLLWAGPGDHLDIVGHFRDDDDRTEGHTDWLISGSHFDRRSFNDAMDSLALFLLARQ